MKARTENSRIFMAVVLIVIGTLFMFNNFDLFHFPKDIITWKLVFVFIAINQFLKGKLFSSIFWGVVAVFVIFPAVFHSLHISNFIDLWPLLLIGIGVDKILKYNKRENEMG